MLDHSLLRVWVVFHVFGALIGTTGALPNVIEGQSPTRIDITPNPTVRPDARLPAVDLPQVGPQSSVAPEVYQTLAQVESGGNPNAVSPVGARGLTQIMPETARSPGHGVTPMRDNSVYNASTAAKLSQNAREKLSTQMKDAAMYRDDVQAAIMSRYNKDYDIQRDQSNSELIAAGLRPGSAAYEAVKDRELRGRNDALNAAILSSGQEASRDYGMDLQGRNQVINELGAFQGGAQVNNPFAGSLGYQGGFNSSAAPTFAGVQQQANATKSGAFGGGRDAIMRAEAARGLASQKNEIQGKGLQAAYDNATAQYNQGFNQNMGLAQLQNQFGGQQQQQVQNILSNNYQDFQEQKRYPYQQLEFLSNVLRGTPMGTVQSMYQAPGSAMGQLAGLGMGAYGLSQMGMKFKDGGSVQSYEDGGSITRPSEQKLEDMVDSLTDQQLQQILQHPTSVAAYRAAQEELALRASMDHGIASAANGGLMDRMMPTEESMARGGVVAFAKGGDEGEKKEESSGVSGLAYLAAAFPGLFQAGKAVVGPAASSIGSALKAVGTGVSNAGSAYMSPAASAVLAGGLKASDWSTKMLDQASDEQLEGIADSGDPNLALSAAILREGRKTEQKKQQYADEVGGGRGKMPASAYDVKAMAEHLGKSTRGPTARDEKGGKGGKGSGGGSGLVQAATAIAGQQGVPKEDFETIMDRMMNKFKGANDKDLQGIKDYITKSGKDAEEIKGQMLNKAITEFGFNLAAQASKPGQGKGLRGLLAAGAAAAPTISASVAESQKLMRAADENARKMQIEFTKYKVALDKGDQQMAVSLASNIRQMQMQQAQLDETIRSNKAKEGLLSQRNAAMAGRGQEKTFAPILRGIGAANQMASKNAMELIKARPDLIQKGEKPEDALERVRAGLAAKYRKEAVPMFGPTGKVYGGGNDDDMED